jgi:hypothetical protein
MQAVPEKERMQKWSISCSFVVIFIFSAPLCLFPE